MNTKRYRHVYSKRLGCLVAVSEIARSHGGGGATASDTSTERSMRLTMRPLCLALALTVGGPLHARRCRSAASSSAVKAKSAPLAPR